MTTHLQDIKQAYTVPALGAVDLPDWFRQFIARNYTPLAQETNLLKKAFEVQQVPVTGGALNVTVTLISPYPDAVYTPLATPSWVTMVYIAAPGDVTATSVKFTFGVAAPGGGGTLYVVTAR